MLQVKDITFSYLEKNIEAPVLSGLNFNVKRGEHLTIIGESGSGKSTLLKVIYGEYDLDKGHIFWNDTEILGPKYNLVVGYDFMKYVAQEFELMPFITVEENIGKHLSNFFREKKDERVQELLKVVELEDLAKTKVKTLSGGQKQRVALARALAEKPEIILLDEPFSHIDNFQKQSLRRSIFNYLKEQNITCVVASHDREDVLGYADRMIVLQDSKIIADASPQDLYKNPKTALIASFFGEFNLINNEIVYAHQLRRVAQSNLKVKVTHAYFKGNYYLIEAQLKTDTLFFENNSPLEVDQEVYVDIFT